MQFCGGCWLVLWTTKTSRYKVHNMGCTSVTNKSFFRRVLGWASWLRILVFADVSGRIDHRHCSDSTVLGVQKTFRSLLSIDWRRRKPGMGSFLSHHTLTSFIPQGESWNLSKSVRMKEESVICVGGWTTCSKIK